MAENSNPQPLQDPNPQLSEPENPQSQPPKNAVQSDLVSPQQPSLTPPPPPTQQIPNPNSATTLVSRPFPPYAPPPSIGSSGAAVPPPAVPSFRPAGASAPISSLQFTPLPASARLPNYQQQGPGVPPPGVSSAAGMVAPPPMVPGGAYQVPPGQPPNPLVRPPYVALPNGYMPAGVPQGTIPPPGVPRYPYQPIVRPAFAQRPPGTVGVVPPISRPPVQGIRPPVTTSIVRPPVVPVVTPAEKPQTTIYVGKIAPTVENDFMLSLLQFCGPVKSWKRPQDPSNGTLKAFGFCEFESAEGVLRSMRLLSKLNIDGQGLVLNVNQATKEYLELYVERKKESSKHEVEGTTKVEKSEGDKKNEQPKPASEESNVKNESEHKEGDMSTFGLVADEDREADREAREKITNILEERLKNRPPPPPLQKADVTATPISEGPAKSGEKDSDDVKKDDKNGDEMTSSRAGTESPDRGRRHDSKGRERDKEKDLKREKERELERIERERERERARRERERDLEIQRAERLYKERVKEWEAREKEKEYQRKYEKEREKEKERERRRLVKDQEDESDDDSRRRRRRSDIEDRRMKRQREKEADMADRLKEQEEIAEAKKKAEEEQQKQRDREALQLSSAPTANGKEKSLSPETASNEIGDKVRKQIFDNDSGFSNDNGEVVITDSNIESVMMLGSTSDSRPSGNAAAKKLGFGLSGLGKRTAVPSVFKEEDDEDSHKEKKMRPLVPIDYSMEELQAVQLTVTSKDDRPGPEKDRSHRNHDRSSHREREQKDYEATRIRDGICKKSLDREHSSSKNVLDAKQLIDMIPKTKEELFSYDVNWVVYDKHGLHERIRPWIAKKITEFLGEEETTLVDYIVSSIQDHVKAPQMLELLQSILDEEAEMFVLKMWRMLIFEIKRVETGLASKPRA